MIKYRLKDIVEEPISGEWGSDDLYGDGVYVLRTTNFTTTGEIDYSNVVKRKIDSKKIETKRLKVGDLIIEKSGGGPKTPVGRVVLFDKDEKELYLCNNFTAILRPKTELINTKYLLYQFLHFYHIGKVKQYQNQTTGLYNLKLSRYLSEEIELPDIHTQEKIVAYLDRVRELINKRLAAIELLDEYIRSVFIEMFGDPVLDNKKIGKKPLSFFGDWKSGGTPPKDKSSYYQGNIPWYASGELNSTFLKPSKKSISHEAIQNSSAKYIEKNSLLVGMVDTAALKLGITTTKSSCNQNVAFSKLNTDLCTTEFIYYSLLLGKEYFLTKRIGARQKILSVSKIKDLEITYPNIDSQERFSKISVTIEKMKELFSLSLDSLKILFQAKLQDALSKESLINEEEVFETLLQNFTKEDLKQSTRLKHLISWINKAENRFSTFDNYNNAWDRLRELLEDGSIEQTLVKDEIKLKVVK